MKPSRHFLRVSAAAVAAVLAGLVGGVAVSPDGAAAARPVKGALYAEGGPDALAWAYLQVSKSGRWLNPRRSMAEGFPRACGATRYSRIRLGSRRRPVRITKRGRFRFVRRRGSYVFRLRGAFETKNKARIRFRYRREPARARPRDCDDSGRLSLVAKRVRLIPFHDCRTHPAQTVLSAPTGRVFWEPTWGEEGWMTFAYACLYSANKRIRLYQDNDDDSDLAEFQLVGPLLGLFRNGWSRVIEVRDLRDGSIVRTAPVRYDGPFPSLLGYPAYYRLWDYRLKENGSLAWTLARYSVSDPNLRLPRQEVWALDGHGQRLLDAGPNIDLESVALNGSTLTWINAGTTRSATLY